MDRRTAVASQLLKRAGVTGDHMSLAGSLPRETLDQFDKVMGRRDPTVPRTAGGIMSFADGGGVPKDKPRSPVGQGVYGLGDVEYRAALNPQFTDVVEDKDGNMSDDYVGLLGLRALEQKHNYDYGKFIDADARRLDEDFSRNIGVLGGYNTQTDQIRVKTTPSESQRLHALEVPDAYRALFSRENALSVTAHELGHAGSQRLDNPPSVGLQHKNLRLLDWERMHKTEASRNVSSVLKKYLDTADYQDEKPELDVKPSLRGVFSRSYMDRQAQAREKYEALGPPRVKNYEDGGAVEPRPTGLTLSSGRPVWKLGNEIYSEKTVTVPYGEGWVNVPTVDVDGSILSEEEAIRLLDQIGPVDIVTGEPLPVFDRLAVAEQKASQRSVNLNMELKGATQEQAVVESDGFSVIPQFDARVSGGESNRSVPWGDDRINIADETMGGIARLGASLNFPGGNLTGGVTGVHDKTTRRLPDEWQAYGAPETVEYGNRRGFVPTNYDLSGTYGRHTGTVNVQPRREGADRDAIGGRSAWNLGYEYRPSEAESLSITGNPFGRRVMKNYKTGETEMDRSIRVQYNRRF